MRVKAGYLTTEFWSGVLASVGAWLADWQGSLSPRWAAIATSFSMAAYAISRAITKHGVATSGKPVVTVPAAPAPPTARPEPVVTVQQI
jgi:hypothetical protein